jgi:YbbR domain-containing protein
MITFLRQRVFNNIGLKLLSLGIAVLLWVAVTREPRGEVVLAVPVEFQNAPQNLDFTPSRVPEAEVRVQGPERVLRALAKGDVHASISLANAAPGEHTYDLTAQQVHVPREMSVLQVTPAQMRITFARQITKEVPVRPRVIGTFATGVQIANVTPDPAQVAVVGPENRVKQLESVLTDPVDATGVLGTATFTTNVYVPDPQVRLAHPEPIHVTVTTDKASTQAASISGQRRD